jgi:hypothetical protein
MSSGIFFDVTLRGQPKIRFMQKVQPRLAMAPPPGGSALTAAESFSVSALLHDLHLTSWPDGLDFVVLRFLDVMGYGGRSIMGAAWHTPGALRVIVRLTTGFIAFARMPAATVATIPRLLVRLGAVSAVPLLLGFRDVGIDNQENWGEVDTADARLMQFIDVFLNVQMNSRGELYVRTQKFEGFSREDFRVKIGAQFCDLADRAREKGASAWDTLTAAASSIADLESLTGEHDAQVLEACAAFFLRRNVDKILALSLAEVCGRLAAVEQTELLVFDQPSDSLARLVALAATRQASAIAPALQVDFGRATAVDPRAQGITGESGRNLAEFLADTPALPVLEAAAETDSHIVGQLKLLTDLQVLGRQARQVEPAADEAMLMIAKKLDATMSVLSAQFLALTADPNRKVRIGGQEVTLKAAGWIDSWVPVMGEDRIQNAACARRVLCGYRERTWQASWWLLSLAKELGVVFE